VLILHKTRHQDLYLYSVSLTVCSLSVLTTATMMF